MHNNILRFLGEISWKLGHLLLLFLCEGDKGQYKELFELKTMISPPYQNLAKEDKRRGKTRLLKLEPINPQAILIERITQQLSHNYKCKVWV